MGRTTRRGDRRDVAGGIVGETDHASIRKGLGGDPAGQVVVERARFPRGGVVRCEVSSCKLPGPTQSAQSAS